jgi:putative membrane protein
MIKDNPITIWIKDQEKRHGGNWLVILFVQPGVYLFTLLKKTIYIGLCLFLFFFILEKIGIKDQILPSAFHSVIGIVIGLLLVFRVGTAYDRWWEARKLFAAFHASILYLNSKNKNPETQNLISDKLKELNKALFDFTLSSTKEEATNLKNVFLKRVEELSSAFYAENLSPQVYSLIEKKMADIIENFCALERVKDTPIPTSYALHIKISILSYLFTLPLGLFHEYGYVSIPFAMFIYFVIGGIEIISNEIENPFEQAPNDLPLKDYREENNFYITEKNEQKSTNNIK